MNVENESNSNALKSARQGNTKAIAFLLNKNLNPKGINCKISAKEKNIYIVFEASRVLPKEKMVELVRNFSSSLGLNSFFTYAKVYGQQINEELPDWAEELKLDLEGFRTEHPQKVLEQFLNLKARTSIGVSYIDLPPILGIANQAVQNFKRSDDKNISQYCSTLIDKVMLYYQLSLEVTGVKVERVSTVSAWTFGLGDSLVGIGPSEDLGVRIKAEIPGLPKTTVSDLYDFDLVIATLWEKAWALTDELDNIVNDKSEFLRIKDEEFSKHHDWTIDRREDEDNLSVTQKPLSEKSFELKHNSPNTQEANTADHSQQNSVTSINTSKNRVTVGLCGIFLGFLGIHKFILGYNLEGFILLGITVLTLGSLSGLTFLIGLVEGIIYLLKSDKQFQKTYVQGKKGWF